MRCSPNQQSSHVGSRAAQSLYSSSAVSSSPSAASCVPLVRTLVIPRSRASAMPLSDLARGSDRCCRRIAAQSAPKVLGGQWSAAPHCRAPQVCRQRSRQCKRSTLSSRRAHGRNAVIARVAALSLESLCSKARYWCSARMPASAEVAGRRSFTAAIVPMRFSLDSALRLGLFKNKH